MQSSMRRESTMKPLRVEPIGIIRSSYKTREDAPRQGGNESATIEIHDAFAEGLKDIERFSHLHIFYFLHESEGYTLTTATPWDEEIRGIFATRSPHRPTPLGYAVVELVKRKGNILEVKGLDAIDGTPVIDIKPYSPGIDAKPLANRGWFTDTGRSITPRVYTWDTRVRWKQGKEGVLSGTDKHEIGIGCPPEFGGESTYWSPEHLFVASIEVCIMTTFIDLLSKENPGVLGYESTARGSAQLVAGKFRFTEIEVKPVVFIEDKSDVDKVEKMLYKAKETCLVSNSLTVRVTMKPEIRRA
jgi:tRNA-Thr(GGU) m(6)t(6)A37 methyltransferase TsaA